MGAVGLSQVWIVLYKIGSVWVTERRCPSTNDDPDSSSYSHSFQDERSNHRRALCSLSDAGERA